MRLSAPAPASRQLNRNVVIGSGVVLLHVAALWALQSGLLRRAVEVVVPVEILSEMVTPPQPKIEPPPPPPQPKPEPPEPPKQPVIKKVERIPPPPRPVAIPQAPPAPNAPAGVVTPQPPPPPVAAPVAPEPAPAPPPAPARVELPVSDADYLQNPKPPYPPISKRLGEQGKVVVRVFIGADGSAQKGEIRQSSGFERLDQTALSTALKWRYVPGKRGGVPEPMWVNVPINFVLE
jgi:periplasmic protein TonB